MQISSLKKLASYLGKKVSDDRQITGFSVDSRSIEPGMVYCALQGERCDGHEFISEVFRKGASACIVEKSLSADGPVFVVPNVINALQNIAQNLISANERKVIAVTGSVGKTSVKEMIFQLLNPSLKPFKTPGNSNSQVGLPLAILNHLDENHKVAVLEMGMSKAGEIAGLVQVAPPDVALINTVGYCHAQFFSDISAIAKAKAEIFSHPKTSNRLYHADVQSLFPEIERNGSKAFGLDNPSLAYSLMRIGKDLVFKSPENQYLLPPLESYLSPYLHNVLASLSAVSSAGFDVLDCLERIGQLKLPEKRFQRLEKKGVILINDSYNACPLSMKAALTSLPVPQNGGKRIAVLGQMAELGRFSETCHQEVAAYALDYVDHLICYGNESLYMVGEWKKRGRKVDYFDQFEKMASYLKEIAHPQDVVLIKGSNSNHLWKLLDEFES